MTKHILYIGLLLPSILFGQLDRSILPIAGKAPVINIKDSEVFTTENGITVILSENHNLPKVSDYLTGFNFTKGVWFAVRNGKTPKLQEFRYELINKLI